MEKETRIKISKATKGLNNPNFKHGRYIKNICIDCPKKIDPTAKRCKSCENIRRYKNKINHPMFNKKCPKHSEEMKGFNNSNWNNGSSKLPYAFEFNKELKEQIRKRDNYECQNCAKTQKQELKDLNRKLSIHHIDYNKKNCKEKNLITLCNQCNLRVNINRDYWYAYFTYKMENKCLK